MKKIYIASPLGFTEPGRIFLYQTLIPIFNEIKLGYIDPWRLTPAEDIESVRCIEDPDVRRLEWMKLNRVIASNNVQGIIASHGILAVLDGPDVDSGTASEIGYAAALNKRISGYRSDFRLCGDNEGSVVNLQVEYFILNSGGKIVSNIDDLRAELVAQFSV